MKNVLVALGEHESVYFTNDFMSRMIDVSKMFLIYYREHDFNIPRFYSLIDLSNLYYLSGDINVAKEYLYQIPGCIEMDEDMAEIVNNRLCFYNAVDLIRSGQEPVQRFEALLNDECQTGLRTGIGESTANIDTVIHNVAPLLSLNLITDNTGNSYTATTVMDSTANYAVIKTGANQNQVWQFELDGWGKGADSAKVITADNAGYLYAAGKTWNGTTSGLVTTKIDIDGNPVWTAFYPFKGMDATPVGITVDSNFIVSVYALVEDSLTSNYSQVRYSQCDTSCVARLGTVFDGVEKSETMNSASTIHSINFYPNPANDILTVEYLSAENINFRLIDVTGRTVINEQLIIGSNSRNINISTLPTGVYSVMITSGEKVHQVRMLSIVR